MDIKDFRNRLWKYLPNFYNDEKFSDFEFVLNGGDKMNGHKFILLLRCDRWNIENIDSMSILDLSGYSRPTGELFIRWIYTGLIQTDDGAVWTEMLNLAASFNLSTLYERCQFEIENNVGTRDNLSSKSNQTQNTLSETDGLEPRRKSYRATRKTKNQLRMSPEKMQHCQLCGKTFSTQYGLSKHLQSCDHKQRLNKNNVGLDSHTSNVDILKSKSDWQQNLIQCNSETHATQNWISDISSSDGLPSTITCKPVYECDVCSESFTLENDQEIHVQSHKIKTMAKLSCEFCLKEFLSEEKLQKHSVTHTKVKILKCEVCGKIFKTAQNLRRHLRLHTGEKPYLCSHCGQGFIQFTQLQVHLRGHSGEKPYHCDQCPKAFASKFVYKQHLDIHSTGQKKYICDICGLGFNRQSNCRRHIQLHTNSKPFKCDECGKAYSKKHSLKMHKHQTPSSKSCPKYGSTLTALIPVSMATVTNNHSLISVSSFLTPVISNDYINVQTMPEK